MRYVMIIAFILLFLGSSIGIAIFAKKFSTTEIMGDGMGFQNLNFNKLKFWEWNKPEKPISKNCGLLVTENDTLWTLLCLDAGESHSHGTMNEGTSFRRYSGEKFSGVYTIECWENINLRMKKSAGEKGKFPKKTCTHYIIRNENTHPIMYLKMYNED